jgi:predicted PurR-regulated permease PerM
VNPLPWLERAAAWSWRLLLVGAVLAAGLWILGQLWLVLVPIAVAILLARILIRRWTPSMPAAFTAVSPGG